VTAWSTLYDSIIPDAISARRDVPGIAAVRFSESLAIPTVFDRNGTVCQPDTDCWVLDADERHAPGDRRGRRFLKRVISNDISWASIAPTIPGLSLATVRDAADVGVMRLAYDATATGRQVAGGQG